ncbi:MAG: ABC transporter permease [Ruminococcaceae bacterium]|nr:ABC transporter permease [Oscillospiraceae bacterium]
MKRSASIYSKLCASPYIVWMLIFIFAPLLMVFYYTFTDSSGALTFNNIIALDNYAGIFVRSILYGLITTVISLIIAFPLAYIISQKSVKYQSTMIILLMVPMWMNFLIRTYSWMNILSDNGIINFVIQKFGFEPVHMINTSGAVILGMVYNFMPYMVLPIYSVISKMDKSVIEAAQDLGCNKFKVLTKVILPYSLPGIASGITMVFVPSVSTFYISQKLGGGKYDMIGDTIERQFQTSYNYNLGASISLVLMVLLLVCMAFMNTFTNENDDEGGIIV